MPRQRRSTSRRRPWRAGIGVLTRVGLLTGLVAGLLVGLLAGAAPAAAQPGRIPTVTRLVKLFLEQEQQLADALQRGDAAALQRLLAADFEQRDAAQPATPLARAEWLALATQAGSRLRPAVPMTLTQMSAHEHPGLILVSFQWRPERPADAKRATALFVVDAWVQRDAQWQLLTRYAAPLPSGSALPGGMTKQ